MGEVSTNAAQSCAIGIRPIYLHPYKHIRANEITAPLMGFKLTAQTIINKKNKIMGVSDENRN